MYKFFIFLSLFSLYTIYYILSPAPVLAQGTAWSSRCVKTVNTNSTGTGQPVDVPTIQGFECLFANILKVVVTGAGIAFFIMFIMGGFQYMQSSGDPKAIAAASSTLTYAIIGLVGAIVSWLILLFIKDFTGVDVTKFQIPS